VYTNNRGSALISVMMLAIILNCVFAAVYMTVSHTQKMTGVKRITTSALSIAEAGKEKLYGEITCKSFTPLAKTRINAYVNYSFNGGLFSVSCSSNQSLDTVWVESKGQVNSITSRISVVAAVTPEIGNISPAALNGAITARSNVELLGNINIDGRDHDTNAVVTGNGVFGVSTCSTLSVGGSSSIGGNGIAPGKKGADPATYQENVPVTSKFDSPEAFLGLPAGALDKFKTTTLTTPINGIVYLTGNFYGPVHFGNSFGILIIHNTFTNAQLQTNGGTFKGLIIIDQMDKINGNATILGGVATLCTGTTSTFGNGNSDILYSSTVLNNLGEYCPNVKKKLKEISWKESLK
jgi:hypothetical protein